MATARGSIGRIGGMALALALGCGFVPAAAMVPMPGLIGEGHIPVAQRHLRMREGVTGATVSYFDDIMTGGMECPPGSETGEGCLYWDGLMSMFEVIYEGVTETDAMELKKGVIVAVVAFCPSARGTPLAVRDVVQVSETEFRLPGACPALDRKRGGN